jgi:hypothetical protein
LHRALSCDRSGSRAGWQHPDSNGKYPINGQRSDSQIDNGSAPDLSFIRATDDSSQAILYWPIRRKHSFERLSLSVVLRSQEDLKKESRHIRHGSGRLRRRLPTVQGLQAPSVRFEDGNDNADANDNADGNDNADANDNAEKGEYFYSERRSSECSPNQLSFDSGFRGGVRIWRPCCCVYGITHYPPKLNLFLRIRGRYTNGRAKVL